MQASLDLPPDAASVSVARIWVRVFLDDWHAADVEHEAVLITSELVSNVVLHARTPMTVSLECSDGRLRITVTDRSMLPVAPRDASVHAATGRGLRLLRELSAAWGVEALPAGKRVWAELTPTACPLRVVQHR